ncbi:hypothetical protein Pint_06762 [Pistacia integerrima]|uniref:Uncharacterized protein n=1 Tax=Pistacia integerrima TaxID=434235 RepID=A0ACC0XY74_9ROSI|nr:hypothetical protein Pint_06762 [Pistacia integerrima]
MNGEEEQERVERMEMEEKDKEKLVFMWGYLLGALPQRSPVVVRLPATVGSAWKDVCGGGCGFAMAISAPYFIDVVTIAALIGQNIVRKLIILLGRASLIIFVLAFTIFVSVISLGGVGISNMIEKIEAHDYMRFENLYTYDA